MRPKSSFTLLRASLLLIAFLLIMTIFRDFFGAVSKDKVIAPFRISQGESIDSVADRLREAKLIHNENAFRLLSKIKNIDTKIKAGVFRLSPHLTPVQILTLLTDPGKEFPLTIPEGYSTYDIDRKLFELGFIPEKGAFLKTAKEYEGFLFPDTYFVENNVFDAENLIFRMKQNFDKKVDDDLQSEILKQGKALKEIITIASIVEKEVHTKEDYPKIAGILWKRFDNGWPLGADFTLLYDLPEYQETKDPSLVAKNLNLDSPYNTRKFKGLPPTPIGNPGLETIRAAVFPETTPYWFYLTTKDGKVIYATSNERHNENKRKYLQ